MLRFDLRLLPEDEATNDTDLKIITAANEEAKSGAAHLKKLVGKKRCHKHPSAPNKIRVFAVKGGNPHAELVAYCCPAFVKLMH